jgi:hypothetical protein
MSKQTGPVENLRSAQLALKNFVFGVTLVNSVIASKFLGIIIKELRSRMEQPNVIKLRGAFHLFF